MTVEEQIDLFDLDEPASPALNGFYYERASGRFVSFVLGRRHWEVTASGCKFDKQWQEKIKRERAI